MAGHRDAEMHHRQPESPGRVDQAQGVLPRLDPPDGEDERLGPPALAEGLGRGRAEVRPHAVGHDAEPVARDAEQAGQLVGFRVGIRQDHVRQVEQLAPPGGEARCDRSKAQGRQAGGLTQPIRLQRQDRAGLVPADRRDRHRHAARPRQSGELEPLARHPEEMEQPGRFQPVGPGGERPDADAMRLEMPAGLDELVLAAAGRLERRGRSVQEDGSIDALASAPRGQPRGVGRRR